MPQWLTDIIDFFTAPTTETLLAGLATYFMQLLTLLGPLLIKSGTTASAHTQIAARAQALVDGMERITSSVTTDPVKSLAHVKNLFPTYEALEAAMPGIMQDLDARYTGMSDMKATHAEVGLAIHPGFANGRMKAVAAGKPLQRPK